MSRERLPLGPCATVNQQQPWTIHGVRSGIGVKSRQNIVARKMATNTNYRVPDPLRINGSNGADDWRRFREQYEHGRRNLFGRHGNSRTTFEGGTAHNVKCRTTF